MVGNLVSNMIYGEKVASISKKQIAIILFSAVLYCAIDVEEKRLGADFGPILSFVRAISIISVLFIVVRYVLNKFSYRGRAYSIIKDCGTYSLQLYLFNGFLLTAFRIMICNVLHSSSPVIIVCGIWIGNIATTLISCKYIIPRIPFLRELCGLKQIDNEMRR